MPPVLLWFRRDLRLIDNPALAAAMAPGQPIVPVYVSDEMDTGGASRWWLHHSLLSLEAHIRRRGGELLIRRGDPAELIPELAASTGASAVYFGHRYEPAAIRQEQALARSVGDKLGLFGHHGHVLRHPDSVRTQGDAVYKVFTPYYKRAMSVGEPELPDTATREAEFESAEFETIPIDQLGLLPRGPDWSAGLQRTWEPGEDGALQRLDAAAEQLGAYAEHRDHPSIDKTSRLSPHLHFGEISPRQVWHAVKTAALRSGDEVSAEMLLRQLYWRDFSAYLLYHFPGLPSRPLRPEFEHFPWIEDPEALAAWQAGRTGYPLVDAGMRQLWETGWMHNRVRMVVASFLVKHLLIPWQQGADWFLDTLVDADLANNSASWQWVAGCGTDAAPYFRIFNPIAQGKKFDPDGDYVRRYVPELADMPKQFVHEPWLADTATQRRAGVIIGEDYPQPLVDHAEARQRALDAYDHSRDLLKSGS